MRVLLASSASYAPPRGGSTHSNLAWLRELAARGHECEVVAGVDPQHAAGGALHRDSGVVIGTAANPGREREMLHQRVREFRPDIVLVSSEDLSHILLREAHRSAPGRVVYVAHTPQFFPFGSASWNPDPHAADLVRQSAAVIVIGRHMAGYVERATGVSPHVIHPPIYGSGPFTRSAVFDRDFVTILNPSAVKGISIFLATARALPEVRFAALPSWATNCSDHAALAALRNVTILDPVRHIDEFLGRTRVLLMPSLWYEGFGLIVMEAMLRGIPVIASDSGGLQEAKSGTGYVIPVRPIERYERTYDDRHMPCAVVPDQDIGPWLAAVAELAGDPAAWRRESERSFSAATAFVSGQAPGALENMLASLRPSAVNLPAEHSADRAVAALSPEKRALLLRRLNVKRPG